MKKISKNKKSNLLYKNTMDPVSNVIIITIIQIIIGLIAAHCGCSEGKILIENGLKSLLNVITQ